MQEQIKHCSRCGIEKSFELFSKDRQHSTGRKSACKECASSDFKNWRSSNIEEARFRDKVSQYKSKYGLSQDEAITLASNRIGCCTICKEVKPLIVDHCHTSGEVRGFICSACNSVLGYAKDNINTLQMAITYLKDHYELL